MIQGEPGASRLDHLKLWRNPSVAERVHHRRRAVKVSKHNLVNAFGHCQIAERIVKIK